ncbi:hypothetical protein [Hymenobacter cellulosivorans]|uniref:PAS fold-4 domain-containing protein n=1 Tax=Hymenobacter cellulosivorans TaxID=2932249 RepID=A0ABY4FAM5_9BACT|nr:hypothetical protein [Hymenobacter cellulosivorans]UOQ53548.1 hypothetical protein MUN80_02035 [Hymenobacter cellulosivorans]
MREQQLQSILRHMPAGIATLLGPELRYGFVNEAMRALLGGDTPRVSRWPITWVCWRPICWK